MGLTEERLRRAVALGQRLRQGSDLEKFSGRDLRYVQKALLEQPLDPKDKWRVSIITNTLGASGIKGWDQLVNSGDAGLNSTMIGPVTLAFIHGLIGVEVSPEELQGPEWALSEQMAERLRDQRGDFRLRGSMQLAELAGDILSLKSDSSTRRVVMAAVARLKIAGIEKVRQFQGLTDEQLRAKMNIGPDTVDFFRTLLR